MDKHADVAKEMEKMHNEDPRRWVERWRSRSSITRRNTNQPRVNESKFFYLRKTRRIDQSFAGVITQAVAFGLVATWSH
jgi:hypothetical protein